MPQDKPSQFPAIIHSLADDDYLLLSQRSNETDEWVSVKCRAGDLKDYLLSTASGYEGWSVWFGEDDHIYYSRVNLGGDDWTLNRMTTGGIESVVCRQQSLLFIDSSNNLLTVSGFDNDYKSVISSYELGTPLSELPEITHPALVDPDKTATTVITNPAGQYAFVHFATESGYSGVKKFERSIDGTAFDSPVVIFDESLTSAEIKISTDQTKAAVLSSQIDGTYHISFYALDVEYNFSLISSVKISDGNINGITLTNANMAWVSDNQILIVIGDKVSESDNQTFLKSIKLMPDDSISVLNVVSSIDPVNGAISTILHVSSDGEVICAKQRAKLTRNPG